MCLKIVFISFSMCSFEKKQEKRLLFLCTQFVKNNLAACEYMHTHTYKNEYIYICDEKVREKNEREEKMFVQYLFTAS